MTNKYGFRYRAFMLLGWILTRWWIRAALVRHAKKHPFKHLAYSNGGWYMKRYWIFNERWRIPFLPAIRLHHILSPDNDRDKHDHPFGFRSFILSGWYLEEDLMGNYIRYEQGMTYYSRSERFHKIVAISPGGVWTFVICGRKTNPWGFLTMIPSSSTGEMEVRKIHHRDYDNGMYLVDGKPGE